MMALSLVITRAGRDALVDAEGGETAAISIVSVGLTATPFVMSPTLEALPGEFKRLDSLAGQAVDAYTIHMSAQDSSAEIYDLTGLGFFLADGTLFAVYSQDTPIFRKVSIAAFLLAFDVRFESDIAGLIELGDSIFSYPPATEDVKGVAEIATTAEAAAGIDDRRIITPRTLAERISAIPAVPAATEAVQGRAEIATSAEAEAGTDHTRIVTPKTLMERINAIASFIGASITALTARTVTGAGLATGGGDLSANRTITVTAATGADIDAGTANDRAVTPASLRATSRSLGPTGWIQLSDGRIEMWGTVAAAYSSETSFAVTFPTAFPTACDNVVIGTAIASASGGADGWAQLIQNSVGAGGFSAQVQSMGSSWGVSVGITWRAKGR